MEIKKLNKQDWPEALLEIADPPEQLNYRGQKPNWKSVFLTVVGSRRYSGYGKDICEKLIAGLRGHNITIVSGLAFGIDSIAHKTALATNLRTISIPGSGLADSVLYPRANKPLADKIVAAGGTLLSEFNPTEPATYWTFPQRNRIMAGLAKAVLIIEATEKSGTLITARLALEYNREVCAVPASIFSRFAIGSNKLLRQGATVITSGQDLLETLGFDLDKQAPQSELRLADCSAEEKKILELLKEPLGRDDLIRHLNIPTGQANIILSAMEIKGLLKETLGKIRIN
ncbi:MAG: DNA-processing protein DprA [Candidatus Pacebacteria bacterium]|nr:DNA-processing protein DprA [Candidatus Paceibacterota bacterium]